MLRTSCRWRTTSGAKATTSPLIADFTSVWSSSRSDGAAARPSLGCFSVFSGLMIFLRLRDKEARLITKLGLNCHGLNILLLPMPVLAACHLDNNLPPALLNPLISRCHANH